MKGGGGRDLKREPELKRISDKWNQPSDHCASSNVVSKASQVKYTVIE
jgi:hypothetical protein